METFKGLTGRRKIVPKDVEAVANLVATRNMQIRGACFVLEINPETFANYISRHKDSKGASFYDLVDKLKQKYLGKLVNSIESSGLGLDDRKPDWRAAAWLSERLAPTQFGQAEKPQTQVNTLNVVMLDAVKRIFIDSPAPNQPAIVDVEPIPQARQELPAPVKLPTRKPKVS